MSLISARSVNCIHRSILIHCFNNFSRKALKKLKITDADSICICDEMLIISMTFLFENVNDSHCIYIPGNFPFSYTIFILGQQCRPSRQTSGDEGNQTKPTPITLCKNFSPSTKYFEPGFKFACQRLKCTCRGTLNSNFMLFLPPPHSIGNDLPLFCQLSSVLCNGTQSLFGLCNPYL